MKFFYFVFSWLLFFTVSASAREIIDMTGRKVVIPDTVTKVVATSPPGTYLLYAIDPSVVAGLNFPLWESEKKYTIDSYRKLPVVGGVVGQGRNLNQEVLVSIKPDFMLVWTWRNTAMNQQFEQIFTRMRLPWVNVSLDSIGDYPKALLFMGDLLNKKERALKLYRYAVETLGEAKNASSKIPVQGKITVYYAEGIDGLSTEPANSPHAELISLAGGVNVRKGDALDLYGMEKVSMEQVIIYDPEVILVKEKTFYDRVFSDSRWKDIRAVKNRRVYLIPYVPFNWFDRPPSFMRLLGLKWLLNTLHPDVYKIDMTKETKHFYKLFLGVELGDGEAREVLNN